MVSFQTGRVKSNTPYWLKHRVSAQCDYWVPEGQQLVSKINYLQKKPSLVGCCAYYRFPNKEAYESRIQELRASGERFLGDK